MHVGPEVQQTRRHERRRRAGAGELVLQVKLRIATPERNTQDARAATGGSEKVKARAELRGWLQDMVVKESPKSFLTFLRKGRDPPSMSRQLG